MTLPFVGVFSAERFSLFEVRLLGVIVLESWRLCDLVEAGVLAAADLRRGIAGMLEAQLRGDITTKGSFIVVSKTAIEKESCRWS